MTLHTALEKLETTGGLRVVIVDGGIGDDARQRLERVITQARPGTLINWHTADQARFTGLKTTKWGSTANYLRLLIPEILGDSTRWALYLDGDLLVRSDLSKLWEQAQDTSDPILAVRDFHNLDVGAVFGKGTSIDLGLDPEAEYFNSGVLMINVAMWTSESIPERAFEFVRNHSDVMRHSDQDALNAVLTERWTALDPKWNVMVPSVPRFASQTTSTDKAASALRERLLTEASIYHFTGPRKPWMPGYWGHGGVEYRKALAAGGWFADGDERRKWETWYWTRSPRAWVIEGYRRIRKHAALRYHTLRSRNGSGTR